MFLAIRGNWGTHYDASPPMLSHLSFAAKFLYTAILPQMTLWIGWTVVLELISRASLRQAIMRRGKQAAPAASVRGEHPGRFICG